MNTASRNALQQSPERRRFFDVTSRYGFTTAVLAAHRRIPLVRAGSGARPGRRGGQAEGGQAHDDLRHRVQGRRFPHLSDHADPVQGQPRDAEQGRGLRQAAPGRPTRRRRCAGAESAGGHDPGRLGVAVELLAVHAGGRPDQHSVLVRREPEVRQPGHLGGLEQRDHARRSRSRATSRCSTSRSTRVPWPCARDSARSSRPRTT